MSLLKDSFQNKGKIVTLICYKMYILRIFFNNDGTWQTIPPIQRRLQRTQTIIDDKYWNECVNRSRAGLEKSVECPSDRIEFAWL